MQGAGLAQQNTDSCFRAVIGDLGFLFAARRLQPIIRTHAFSLRNKDWAVRDSVAAGRGRDGRGVSLAGQQAGAPSSTEGVAELGGDRSGTVGALQPGSQSPGGAEPSEYCGDLRTGGFWGHARNRDGTGGRADAGGPDSFTANRTGRSLADRQANLRSAGI